MLRKLILACVLCLGLSTPAAAAIALVNEASGSSTSSVASIATSTALNVTSGNALVVFCVESTSTAAITVSDTAGNTFTSVISASPDASHNITGFYAKNVTGNSSDTVTCHFSPNQSFVAIVAIQYSGVATAAPLDASAQGSSSTAGTTATTGSFTTAVPNEVIVAGAGWEASPTFTAGSGYTIEGATGNTLAVEDEEVTSIQSSVTSSMTSSSSAAWMIAAFTLEAASQPSGGCPTTRALLGVGC